MSHFHRHLRDVEVDGTIPGLLPMPLIQQQPQWLCGLLIEVFLSFTLSKCILPKGFTHFQQKHPSSSWSSLA